MDKDVAERICNRAKHLYEDELKPCKVCQAPTQTVFGIKFKAIPICESCAISIARQQIDWMFKSNQSMEQQEK